MTLALNGVTDSTRSSAIAMSGPKTFTIPAGTFAQGSNLRGELQVNGSALPPVAIPEHMLKDALQDKWFTLEFYGVDLFLYIENPDGSAVSIEYA